MKICAKNAILATRRTAYVVIGVMSLSLAACSKEPPVQYVTISKDAPKFEAPSECDPKSDPRWVDPPDADVPLKESARIMRQNKQGRKDVGVKRDVCWAAIDTYQKQPSSKGKSNDKQPG